MSRIGWELTVSRRKGTSYWRHIASGEGLWPSSKENTQILLETEMKAVEIMYMKKRLAKKEALEQRLPTSNQASTTIDALPIQKSSPAPSLDITLCTAPVLEMGPVASAEICLTVQPQEIDRKREFAATQDDTQHVSGSLATDLTKTYSKRWARASAVPQPKPAIVDNGNKRWVRASTTTEVPKNPEPKNDDALTCTTTKSGKSTSQCFDESAFLYETMSDTQDTCDVAAIPERCIDDESVDGRGYRNACTDMDDKAVENDIDMDHGVVGIDTDHTIIEQSSANQLTEPCFWHVPDTARPSYGKGPLKFFIGGRRNATGKGLYTTREAALASLHIDDSDPSPVSIQAKSAPLTHREKALATLEKELETSPCFVT